MGEEKFVVLDNLPTDKNGDIIWSKCEGKEIPFGYYGITGRIKLGKYYSKKNQITATIENITRTIGVSKLIYCNIESLLNIKTNDYLYESGDVVNELQILEQIWKDGKRAYEYKCTICGNEGEILQTKLKNGTGCTFKIRHKNM